MTSRVGESRGSVRNASGRAMVRGAFVLGSALSVATLIAYFGPQGLALLFVVPAVAALDPALIESLFDCIIFGALIVVAGVGLLAAGERVRAGQRPVPSVAAGVLAGTAGITLALLLSALAGAVQPGSGAAFRPLAFAGGTLVMLFQTGAEELYFRGWLQTTLQRLWGRWPGLSVTAVGFAAVHFVSALKEPLALPVLLLAGLWLGILADRSSGLVLPIAAHFGWNWGEGLLLGAAPNPGIGNFGSLFDYELTGSRLWGASADGLDASMSSIFVLAALIVASQFLPGLPRWAIGPAARG